MRLYLIYSIGLLSCLYLFSESVFSQETNTNVSGIVKSERKEVLPFATVVIVHEPTKNTYSIQTNSKGFFNLFNIKPGGPYTLTISYAGFEPLLKTNLFIRYTEQNFYSLLQGDEFSEFILKEKKNMLDNVTINVKKQPEPKFGMETNIDQEKINSLPSISRNFQDYIRLVPNAKVNGDGGISLAGQNNKYNSFFIDGSNMNDMLGLANNGSAGGRTDAPPISMEAIEEIKVLQSPYNVQYSNFTGGSINAITKSGSNQFKSSAWYYFRNENMAGKSPLPEEVQGTPGEFKRTRLNPFFNQTAGVWASGPLIKNKLFYFLLTEYQSESQPQPYNFSEYKGNSTPQQIFDLVDTVRKRYGYNAGTADVVNELHAKRLVAKIDWNPNVKNKFTLSYRYNNGERIAPQTQNGSTSIRFSNNRYRLISSTHSASFEWKSYFRNSANNRLLVTFNSEVTPIKITGQLFPIVTINDGAATIIFGSSGLGQINRFTSSEFTVLDIYKFVKNNHAISLGMDLDFTKIKDISLNGYFGNYRFRNLNVFIQNGFPFKYSRILSLVDKPVNANTDAAAKYYPLRTGFFINEEIRINENLKITAGIRADMNALPAKYKEDKYFNTMARSEIEKYYDLEGAVTGMAMKPTWQLSPRFGFTYKIPEEKITIQGGAGIFSGHILNVWASQLYVANIGNLNIMPQQYGLYFNPDPYNQPDFQSLGINPENKKGVLQLIARNYKYPAVFRTSLSMDKNFIKTWNLTADIFFTKNIIENRYINVNILPPLKKSPQPGSRSVYSTFSLPDAIPTPGGNPYDNIYLLTNNHGEKGFSYGVTVEINKSIANNLQANFSYCFENSIDLFDPVGTGNTIDGQWGRLETVNGKNFADRSVSDFDLRHRINAALTKKFNYGKWSTLITLIYNGQSGSPFSYVYNGSMINDDGNPSQTNSNADLIYIPTKADLNNMTFLANSNNDPSPQQQKDALNDFIESDKYLRKHRGEFAERNGARLPFTNTIDLRLQQDFKIKLNKKETTISIIYDVFNFTNMLNKKWGRLYFLPNDNFSLITFAGFSDPNTLTPQYKFTPLNGKPWSVQSSTAPGNSARWISQLGIKINFN
ncbi:MAG: TonB-dependent receptor [Bacteroidetes bacterium]|nr:TonB-dependent receptor [Bacteroidota bacterium]MBS1930917.1 TonB-dependent receptor [Bacteroidota bacterium]